MLDIFIATIFIIIVVVTYKIANKGTKPKENKMEFKKRG